MENETINPYNTIDIHHDVHDMPEGTISRPRQDPSDVTLLFEVESNSDISWDNPCPDFSSLLYSPISFMPNIILDDSLILSGHEHQAFYHYQDRFISDRLLKTPQWSMFGCILQSIYHIPMAMHLLIAASSMDLNRRSPNPTISPGVTKAHFRKGSEMLIQLMNVHAEPHHFSTLSSWFFLYLCMGRREILDKNGVDQLSQAILKYIQRYNLDSLSANIKSEQSLLASSWHDSSHSAEPGLIGRLMLLLAAEDIEMGFEGCGGHLANHLFGSEDLHLRIFSQQRYILEQYWGESYPEYEAMHDIQVTPVIEFGNKVGMIFQRVNRLSNGASEEVMPRDLDIEGRISQTETVYLIADLA
ncbi:uncharacterized protein N7496_004103 [Penicillium cataractarum]|uniref:Transcription factor domain-containing protein n=1 Tax=Penicillium cataractarum TaxID=2100454 RepID=A0A9W9SPC0_9EURO|nr:uncharacterized protein N7496_004103 [Penicillium cataractarum]KAJ5381675.1 hypothetical protein N7496_004103 [Penicillium cataractarum]